MLHTLLLSLVVSPIDIETALAGQHEPRIQQRATQRIQPVPRTRTQPRTLVRKRNTPRVPTPHIVTPGKITLPKSTGKALFVPSPYARKRDDLERKRDGIERKRDGIGRKRDGIGRKREGLERKRDGDPTGRKRDGFDPYGRKR